MVITLRIQSCGQDGAERVGGSCYPCGGLAQPTCPWRSSGLSLTCQAALIASVSFLVKVVG